MLTIITILWMLDVYISVSTAIKTTEEIIANVGAIFLRKIRTPAFIMDVIAALPIELIGIIAKKNAGVQLIVLLQMNRLLKVSVHGSAH